MKNIVTIVFFLFLTFNFSYSAENSFERESETKTNLNDSDVVYPNVFPFFNNAKNDKWGVFWINFVIAAIGVYSIYGFAAGIVAVAITYFVTNGNKKAFKMAIWGCLAGCVIGGLLRLLMLFI